MDERARQPVAVIGATQRGRKHAVGVTLVRAGRDGLEQRRGGGDLLRGAAVGEVVPGAAGTVGGRGHGHKRQPCEQLAEDPVSAQLADRLGAAVAGNRPQAFGDEHGVPVDRRDRVLRRAALGRIVEIREQPQDRAVTGRQLRPRRREDARDPSPPRRVDL